MRRSDRDAADEGPAVSSRASQRGLDWFTFFVADIQTGFGPFLSVFLTTQKWTQTDIGLVLSVGSIVGLLCQLPGGWIVDLVRPKRLVALLAVTGIGVSALLIAMWPIFAVICSAKILHVMASAVLGPAIAAITLGLVGHAAVAQRLGRNARFASVGNGVAAGVMGGFGYFISAQAVFYVTAVLAVPTFLALSRIRADEIDPIRADGGIVPATNLHNVSGLRRLLENRALPILTSCVLLFHLANAAMLPLVGSALTARSSQWATALVAACIVLPQLIVAAISPSVGRFAESIGRRPLLLIGFGTLPVRGALLASFHDPAAVVLVQMLDGVSAAVMGVLVPLTLADVSRGTGHFNLAQGIVGSAAGIGATLSTAVAGYLADHLGTPLAFAGLTASAVAAFVLLLAIPETRPSQ